MGSMSFSLLQSFFRLGSLFQVQTPKDETPADKVHMLTDQASFLSLTDDLSPFDLTAV